MSAREQRVGMLKERRAPAILPNEMGLASVVDNHRGARLMRDERGRPGCRAAVAPVPGELRYWLKFDAEIGTDLRQLLWGWRSDRPAPGSGSPGIVRTIQKLAVTKGCQHDDQARQ